MNIGSREIDLRPKGAKAKTWMMTKQDLKMGAMMRNAIDE